jgi:hypothetical protein
MGATYCLAMINRPEDLNIETGRAVLIMYGIDVFASNESPLRALVYARFHRYLWHARCSLFDTRRVGDETISNFSV